MPRNTIARDHRIKRLNYAAKKITKRGPSLYDAVMQAVANLAHSTDRDHIHDDLEIKDAALEAYRRLLLSGQYDNDTDASAVIDYACGQYDAAMFSS